MKKTMPLLMVTIVIVAINIAIPAYAQGTQFSRKFTVSRPGADLSVSSAAIPVTMVHDRAVKDFKNSYENMVGETWARIQSGFMVIYYDQQIRHHRYYNKSGQWQTTIRYLNQGQIPAHIIAALDYSYPGFKAGAAQEFVMPFEKFHLIYAESGKNYKRLRFLNGELELLEVGKK